MPVSVFDTERMSYGTVELVMNTTIAHTKILNLLTAVKLSWVTAYQQYESGNVAASSFWI